MLKLHAVSCGYFVHSNTGSDVVKILPKCLEKNDGRNCCHRHFGGTTLFSQVLDISWHVLSADIELDEMCTN
eukprot:scaffold111456_cov52-Attheya_sp.AAC.2